MKKQIIGVVLAIAATASLVGCSNDSGITYNSSNSSASSNSNSSSGAIATDNSNNSNTSSGADSSNTSSSNTSETSGSNDSPASTSSDASSSEPDSTQSSADVAAVLTAPLPIVYKTTAPVFEKADENAAVPTSLEFLKATGANIDKSDSVIIEGTIEGVFDTYLAKQGDTYYDKQITGKQTYIFVVTKNATYLRATYQDDTYSTSVTAYEEYRVMNEDGTFSTITKSGDKWVATKSEYVLTNTDAPKEIRGPYRPYFAEPLWFEYAGANLYENSIRTFGILRPFASDFTTKNRFSEDDMMVSMPIVRDENKNLVLKINDWGGFKSSDRMFNINSLPYNDIALKNIFRYFPDEVTLYDIGKYSVSSFNNGSNISHIVGNDYLIKTISGRVANDEDDNYRTDISFEFEFTDWDNVEKINVPDYVTE